MQNTIFKRKRLSAKLRQIDVSNLMGISQATYSHIERFGSKITLEMAAKFCEVISKNGVKCELKDLLKKD